MTATSKIKSCHKLVSFKIYIDFKANSRSIKSNVRFYSKKCQSDNHTNNQQKCINCLKPRSNKNEQVCKKCGCNYFYVLNY